MVSHRSYVLIVALMAVVAASSSHADDTLNPATYTSLDGTWTVHVEPATKNGDAGAAYVVNHLGAQVWAKDLPFALWEAAITDTGVVAGVAYEHGLDGGAYPKPDTGHSYLYAIIIDEAGTIRLQDGRPRKGAAVYTNPPSPLEPTASGVIADPLSDTFVIRIPPGFFQQSYTWWRYRLSTGEKLDDVLPDQPKEPDEHGFHKEINVLQVRDAPLVLIHWYAAHFGKSDSNSASIHLTDLNGKSVWRLDLPGEYDALGEDWHWYYDFVEQGIKQIELTGRRFTVRSYRLAERIEYAISGDAADGWSVKEVGRSPDKLPVVNREVEPQLESPLITLKLLGAIKLGGSEGKATLDRVSGATIGPDGRIYATNQRDSKIHVFDSKGNPGGILKPDPDDFSPKNPCTSISIAGNGDAYCQRSGLYSDSVISGYVRFDAQGQRTGFEPCEFDLVTEEWLYKPGTTARWMLGYEKIALTDENGNISRMIDRLPNGDWLEKVGCGAVAPDGSLAVLVSSDWGMRGPATINVYDNNGEPVRTLPCVGRWIPYEMAFNGRVVVTCRGNELQFHYLDGRPATHAKLPVDKGKQDFWYVYFNPDGSELWARNADALEFLRFEVP